MSKMFRKLLARSSLSSTFRPSAVELPMGSSEPLMNGAGKELALDEPYASGKCELRIEGMTCGACVEVSLFGCRNCGFSSFAGH